MGSLLFMANPTIINGQSGALSVSALTQMTTATQTKKGDADMLNWACSHPMIKDQFGKRIVFVQWTDGTSKYHIPVVSNDGSTWIIPTISGAGWTGDTNGDQAIIRLAHDVDPVHDQIDTCVIFDQTDGVWYRCWTIGRDGSNNITSLTRARQMQLEVGNPGGVTMTHDAPRVKWLSDISATFIAWTAANGSGVASKSEVRTTYRIKSGTATDVTQANWLAPMNEASGAGSTDSIGSSVPVKYSCIAKSAFIPPMLVSLVRLTNKDWAFYFAAAGGGGTGNTGTLYYNRMIWSSANSDWRSGLSGGAVANDAGRKTITNFNFNGSGGYDKKDQIIGKAVEGGNGKVAIIVPRWDGAKGDTVVLCTVDPANEAAAATIVDVYSAGGAHSYAPTCDLDWNTAAARYVATYIKTSTQFSYYKLYDAALTLKQNETLLHSVPVDIPYVDEQGTRFMDRDTTVRSAPDKFYSYSAAGVWS